MSTVAERCQSGELAALLEVVRLVGEEQCSLEEVPRRLQQAGNSFSAPPIARPRSFSGGAQAPATCYFESAAKPPVSSGKLAASSAHAAPAPAPSASTATQHHHHHHHGTRSHGRSHSQGGAPPSAQQQLLQEHAAAAAPPPAPAQTTSATTERPSGSTTSTGGSCRMIPGGPCVSCGVTEAPQWRRPDPGTLLLCNRCGIHYMRYRRLPGPKKDAAAPAIKVAAPDSPMHSGKRKAVDSCPDQGSHHYTAPTQQQQQLAGGGGAPLSASRPSSASSNLQKSSGISMAMAAAQAAAAASPSPPDPVILHKVCVRRHPSSGGATSASGGTAAARQQHSCSSIGANDVLAGRQDQSDSLQHTLGSSYPPHSYQPQLLPPSLVSGPSAGGGAAGGGASALLHSRPPAAGERRRASAPNLVHVPHQPPPPPAQAAHVQPVSAGGCLAAPSAQQQHQPPPPLHPQHHLFDIQRLQQFLQMAQMVGSAGPAATHEAVMLQHATAQQQHDASRPAAHPHQQQSCSSSSCASSFAQSQPQGSTLPSQHPSVQGMVQRHSSAPAAHPSPHNNNNNNSGSAHLHTQPTSSTLYSLAPQPALRHQSSAPNPMPPTAPMRHMPPATTCSSAAAAASAAAAGVVAPRIPHPALPPSDHTVGPSGGGEAQHVVVAKRAARGPPAPAAGLRMHSAPPASGACGAGPMPMSPPAHPLDVGHMGSSMAGGLASSGSQPAPMMLT